MTYTVEKIGGTSMSAFDAVFDNILLRPDNPYNRVFVVSAYAGMTDALLECKRSGKPGIYSYVARRDASWLKAISDLEQRMLLVNEHMFADPFHRIQADQFILTRLKEAKNCIHNILETCQYGQFTLQKYLPQIREFLSSIGEAHSAYNTALKLNALGIRAKFIDLSGWDNQLKGSLDDVIHQTFESIDVTEILPIVTGYAYCDEGLMKTYDRGYSEMTFSRIACLTGADQAIIHKEYHLSSADPKIIGPGLVFPIGQTNFDVADQLAALGMEAIHPNAASGLRQNDIPLRIKNTFEPEHEGTLISSQFKPADDKIEIIAGKSKVFALHIFDQGMVREVDNVSCEVMEIISDAHVTLISKEMNANSITYYLSGNTKTLTEVMDRTREHFPDSLVTGSMVALISVTGALINTNTVLSQGVRALTDHQISPIAVYASMRHVSVQFVVSDDEYESSIVVLHQTFCSEKYERPRRVA
jgi:aspartate kinase